MYFGDIDFLPFFHMPIAKLLSQLDSKLEMPSGFIKNIVGETWIQQNSFLGISESQIYTYMYPAKNNFCLQAQFIKNWHGPW